MNAFNKRNFAVDSIACAVFWTVAYIRVFLYTSRSIDLALVGLGIQRLYSKYYSVALL